MDGEHERPKPPADLSVPGLIYRLRRTRWAMYWAPRSDLTKRGYEGKATRLWPSDRTPPLQTEPTPVEWEVISAWCVRYHAEQMTWAHGGVKNDPKSVFDGTLGSLTEIYQTHKRSPFKTVRHGTQLLYAQRLCMLKKAIGKVRVKHITFDDITTWQDNFADDGDGSKPKKARAAVLVKMIHWICRLGSLVLPEESGCDSVCNIFAKMAEASMMSSGCGRRKEYMTAAQCRLIRIKAHELGFPSIALEQAFAFELGVRQKDVIGEWLPIEWPGLSDVAYHGRKWLMGLRWDEVDGDLVLRHRLSKSIHGAQTIMDPEAGTWKAWDLKDFPMIMDELARLCGGIVDRTKLPGRGPIVVNEETGLPWARKTFSTKWRVIANAAGIPANIQNRDSRPGAATEADVAGAATEKIQRGLGHARGATTVRYLREDLEVNRELARARTEKRK